MAGWSVFALCVLSPIFLLVPYLSLHAAALVCGLVVLFRARGEGGRPIRRLAQAVKPGLPVYLFFVLAASSALWEMYPRTALPWAITDSFYMLFVALTLVALNGNDRRWFKAIVVVLPLICLAIFVKVFLEWGSVRGNSPEMIDAVGNIPELYAAYVVLCVPFLIRLLAEAEGLWWLANAGAFASSVMVVTLSEGRAAAALLVAGILLSGPALGQGLRNKLRLVLVSGTLALVAAFGTGFIAGPESTVIERPENFTGHQPFSAEEITPDSPDFQRSLQYREGVKLLAEHPVLGAGYMNLLPHMEELHGLSVGSHNILITAWSELGLAGLALVLWILVRVSRQLWANRRHAFYIAVAVSLFLAVGHAQFRPQVSNVVFGLVLASALHQPLAQSSGSSSSTPHQL